MFERIPPGHGVVGKPSVSNLELLVFAALNEEEYQLGISARSSIITTEVWRIVATEARLQLQVLAHTVCWVTNKHTEALHARLVDVVSGWNSDILA